MSVLHRTPIGGGKEEDVALSEQLAKIIIKISGLFFIVGHHDEDFANRLTCGTEHNSGCRTTQTFHTDMRTACRQAFAQTKHTGMLFKEGQQFIEFHGRKQFFYDLTVRESTTESEAEELPTPCVFIYTLIWVESIKTYSVCRPHCPFERVRRRSTDPSFARDRAAAWPFRS